jgi:hypothetical protein
VLCVGPPRSQVRVRELEVDELALAELLDDLVRQRRLHARELLRGAAALRRSRVRARGHLLARGEELAREAL